MTLPMQTINGKDLARFASDKLHIWSDLIGCEVTHAERGSGVILSVEQRPNYIPLIRIKFSKETATFNSDSFLNGKSSVLVAADLAKCVEEWAKVVAEQDRKRAEREALENAKKEQIEEDRARVISAFSQLASKYNVPADLLWENNKITPLGSILEKLESHEQLDAWELDWLESKKQNRLLATIYFRGYKHSDDPWLLVKACKFLRKANLPEKVLAITSDASSSRFKSSKVLSALLTTRGGALRDLNDLAAAKKSALDAIRASPESYHPHNLIGAILYEEGSPSEGDEHFSEAIRLGSTPRDQEFEIRRALNRSTAEARDRVIEYLLSKDPEKYSWVRNLAERV